MTIEQVVARPKIDTSTKSYYKPLAFLTCELGVPFMALLADTHQRIDVVAWIAGTELPSGDEMKRIVFAAELFREVSKSEGPDVTRAWMLNPSIGNISPLEAIRQSRFDEARTSATRMIEDEWS